MSMDPGLLHSIADALRTYLHLFTEGASLAVHGAGPALLLPFTYNPAPPPAFPLLLGLGATTTTADPIAAILFGAPGHAASAATTLDGSPMTRRGAAGREVGAS